MAAPPRLMRWLVTKNQQTLQAALHTDFGKPALAQLFEISAPLGGMQRQFGYLDFLIASQEVSVPPPPTSAGNRGVVPRWPDPLLPTPGMAQTL